MPPEAPLCGVPSPDRHRKHPLLSHSDMFIYSPFAPGLGGSVEELGTSRTIGQLKEEMVLS